MIKFEVAKRRSSDDELFLNLRRVWEHYGRQPTVKEMQSAPSTIPDGRYRGRWQTWSGACAAFCEWAATERAAIVPPEPARVEFPETVRARFEKPAPALDEDPPARLATVKNSRIGAIVSDVHFPDHFKAGWAAFRAWHSHAKPHTTVMLGDVLDLAAVSRFAKSSSTPSRLVPEIELLVAEANALAKECERLVIVEGNHESRFARAIFGENALALADVMGLSLREVCRAHGLAPTIEWRVESNEAPSLQVGQFHLTHGHNSSGRFGGAKHLAAMAIEKTMGASTVRGHHHRAQLIARTHGGRTAIAVANPCLTNNHDYSILPDWQRGFTILELDAPTYERATPYVVVMSDDGSFSWGGRTFGAVAS